MSGRDAERFKLLKQEKYVKPCLGTIVLQGGWPLFLHRMGVMPMNKNKKLFDFKDLMAFGMFILALLTFIYMICH